VVYPNFIIGPAILTGGKVLASATVILVNGGQVVAEDLFVSMLFASVPAGDDTLILEQKAPWSMTSGVGVDRSTISPRDMRLAPGGFVTVLTINLRIDSNIDFDYHCRFTSGCKGAIPYYEDIFVTKADLLAMASSAMTGTPDMHDISLKMLGLGANARNKPQKA
jgi:hypothetical protein